MQSNPSWSHWCIKNTRLARGPTDYRPVPPFPPSFGRFRQYGKNERLSQEKKIAGNLTGRDGTGIHVPSHRVLGDGKWSRPVPTGKCPTFCTGTPDRLAWTGLSVNGTGIPVQSHGDLIISSPMLDVGKSFFHHQTAVPFIAYS